MQNEQYCNSILILGNGSYCVGVAEEMASLGSGITVGVFNRTEPLGFFANDPRVDIFPVNKIIEFSGQVGNFKAAFETQEGHLREGNFGCVVVAMQCKWASTAHKWGLSEGKNITTVSRLDNYLESTLNSFGAMDQVVFVCGFKHNSWPVSQEKVIKQAMTLREKTGAKVYVLTEHFKVAKEGLERLVREARETGVMFVKFSAGCPDLSEERGSMRIKYYDEALGANIQITPKLVVLEEEACPPRQAPDIAEILGINLDGHGFFQGDYIYNLPIFTNRTGILVTGSGKQPISDEESSVEAKSVTIEVAKVLASLGAPATGIVARLDERKCGQCLTCFRICPHRAISLYYGKAKPEISPLACKGCGVCVAACPMKAIDLENYEREELLSEVREATARLMQGPTQNGPKILIFACQNSAYDAYELARKKEFALPHRHAILKVPCGGRVDLEMIMRAFDTGADGVMVLSCHHDSCKSMYGSSTCENRVKILQDMLEQVGVDRSKLGFGTSAPGASADLADQVMAFAGRIAERL